MKTLKQFLNEKLSKKEIGEGLKDPDVIVGVEFEFILKEEYATRVSRIDKSKRIKVPLEQMKIWKYLPFKKYKVGKYHSAGAGSKFWRIENDSSLPDGGVEIISPAIPLQEFIPILDKMLEFVRKYGYTNESCGLHVNMSYKNKSFRDLDKLKLMVFMDEGWVYKHFDKRENNRYARSVLNDAVNNLFVHGKVEPDEKINMVFDKFKTTVKELPSEKYLGINFKHAFKEDGTNRIEFRYLGGPDYHKKYSQIVTAMGRYSAYMTIAFDENMRKKEYIRKLLRVKNKVEEMRGNVKPLATSNDISNAFLEENSLEAIDFGEFEKAFIKKMSVRRFVKMAEGERAMGLQFVNSEKKNGPRIKVYLLRNKKDHQTIIGNYRHFLFGYADDDSYIALPVME